MNYSDGEWSGRVRLTSFAALFLTGAYILYVCYRQYHLLYAFQYASFDLSNYHQAAWLLSRFREPFMTTRGLHAYADHASFINLIFVPVYWLKVHPLLMLWAETIALGLAGHQVYRLAQHTLGSAWMAVFLSLCFFLYPAVHYLNFENYHPVAFAPLFYLMFWNAYERGKARQILVSAVLLVLVQEQMAALLAGTALYLWVFRKWTYGRYYAAGALLYLFVVALVVIPAVGGRGVLDNAYTDKMFGSLLALVRGEIPLAAYLQKAHAGQNGAYLYGLFAPLGFIPFLCPLPLVFDPLLFCNMLSNWPYAHLMQYHYTSGVIGPVFAALTGAASRISAFGSRHRVRRAVSFGVLGCVLTVSALCTSDIDHEAFQSPGACAPRSEQHVQLLKEVRYFGERLEGKSLSVTYILLPFFSARQYIYRWPNPYRRAAYGAGEQTRIDEYPSYVLLLNRSITEADRDLLAKKGYDVDEQRDELTLFKRAR